MIYSIILPGILVWSAWKMRKLAEEDPERIYAVAQGRMAYTSRKGKKTQSTDETAMQAPSAPAAPSGSAQTGKKSLKERAFMKAEDQPSGKTENQTSAPSVDEPAAKTEEESSGGTDEEA